MTPRKPPKLYGVYLGKDRRFPKNQVIKQGQVYEIDIKPPSSDFPHYLMYVHACRWSIYIPYCSTSRIWEDWMPYDGKIEAKEIDDV